MPRPLAPDEHVADIVEGGGPPRGQLPRRLVVGFYVVCGITALAWVGVTVLNRADDPVAKEPPTLTVVDTPQTWYRAGHGELVVTLRNNSDSSIVIDSATVSNGQPQGTASPFAVWVSAKIGPTDALLTWPDIPFWPDIPILGPLAGHGGTATLAVTVDPPCGDPALPKTAQVTVNFHTSSDRFRQIIPDLLNTDPTDLQTMTNSACHETLKPTTTDGFIAPNARNLIHVNGVSVSFRVPTLKTWAAVSRKWWAYYGSRFIGKEGGDAVVYWTGYPDGGWADLCSPLEGRSVGPSSADLADAVSTAPGTHLVTGPTSVTVGGRPAQHVVLTVRKDLGCDPGYFYSWQFAGGPFWSKTIVGDTISVWIVDVDGKRIFIAGENKELSPVAGGPKRLGGQLEREVLQIIESIRFD